MNCKRPKLDANVSIDIKSCSLLNCKDSYNEESFRSKPRIINKIYDEFASRYGASFENYFIPNESPLPVSVADHKTNVDENAVQLITNIIKDFMIEQKIPGASFCIGRHGKIIISRGIGWASHHVPVHPHHRFRIASISKILTAAATLKLCDEGRLSLAAKVFGPKGLLSEFSPSVTGDRRVLQISVRHLLQHSGGWDREIVGDPVFWRHVASECGVSEPVSQLQLIAYMMTQKLQFSPGKKHAYSNFGYVVLGRVIEKITNTSYESYVKSLLSSVDINRMEIGKTRWQDTQSDEVEYFASQDPLIVESILPGEGLIPAPYGAFSMETGDADGGWISTAEDLVKFAFSLDAGKTKRDSGLLKKTTFEMMLAKPSYEKAATVWYGLGLDVSWKGKAWEHSGTLDGATSVLVKDRNDFCFAFLTNYWPPDSDYTSLISYAISQTNQFQLLDQRLYNCRESYSYDLISKDSLYAVKVRLPLLSYESFFKEARNSEYRPIANFTYNFLDETFVNVICSRLDSNNVHVAHELTRETLELLLKKCCEIRHLESYTHENEIKYIIVYSIHDGSKAYNCTVNWKITHTNTEELPALFRQLSCEEFLPENISICNIDSCNVATILWRKTKYKGWFTHDMSIAQYQADFNKHTRYGHLLQCIRVYKKAGSEDDIRFLSVWTNPGPVIYTSEVEMSRCRLLCDLKFAFENDFYPSCITGYEDEGAMKFTAICHKDVKKV